jgi:hypothetical protein
MPGNALPAAVALLIAKRSELWVGFMAQCAAPHTHTAQWLWRSTARLTLWRAMSFSSGLWRMWRRRCGTAQRRQQALTFHPTLPSYPCLRFVSQIHYHGSACSQHTVQHTGRDKSDWRCVAVSKAHRMDAHIIPLANCCRDDLHSQTLHPHLCVLLCRCSSHVLRRA